MRFILPLVAALVVSSCTERPKAPAEPSASRIESPADGAIVAGEFLVRLSVTGARVVPASGMRVEGEGHHHLFVDADLTPADSTIPKGEGIFHLGSGADTLRVMGMAPGAHRLITRFAYGDHVPMLSVATDTVWITVR